MNLYMYMYHTMKNFHLAVNLAWPHVVTGLWLEFTLNPSSILFYFCFSHNLAIGCVVCRLVLIAPFPDLCLLVPFLHLTHCLVEYWDDPNWAGPPTYGGFSINTRKGAVISISRKLAELYRPTYFVHIEHYLLLC